MSDAAPPVPAGPRGRGRRRPLAVAALVFAGLVLVGVVVASFWKLPDYALVPGTALDADRLVSVPSGVRQHHSGSVFLTDVNLVQLRAIDYLFYRFNSNDVIEPAQSVTGPASYSQYVSQGTIDMATARQAATVVALQRLGYHVRAVAQGIIVYQPDPASPAARVLSDDDVIVSVDGRPITTFASLTAALTGAQPGQLVRVGVHLFGKTARRTVAIRLGEERVENVGGQHYAICAAHGTDTRLQPYEPAGRPRGCLGLFQGVSEIDYRTVGLPFPVRMDPAGIIGPSAGLAYTLALMQELDPRDLTAGQRIAATGTMSVGGQVGDVGGVAQKTVAVRNAGATVFFVPVQEKHPAIEHAGGRLRVFAVSSISEVLADLQRLGGRMAAPPSAR